MSVEPIRDENDIEPEKKSHQLKIDNIETTDIIKTEGRFSRISKVIRQDTIRLKMRFRAASLLLFFMPSGTFSRFRTAIYKLCGIKIGERSLIFSNIEISGSGRCWEKLTIGTDCQINAPLYLDLEDTITIGDHVGIGHHVVFITTDHEIHQSHHRCGPGKSAPIVVENGAWIGARSTILPGVTIGASSVVSAGSVVFTDVAPNKVVGGSPARPIKSLE